MIVFFRPGCEKIIFSPVCYRKEDYMFKNLKSCRKRIIAAVSAAVIAFSSATYFQMHDVSIVQAANGEYRTWKQSDPRWGSIRLGGSSETISQSGCAVTSVAMLLVKAGYFEETDFDPGVFCNFMNSNGGLDGYGNIYWGVVSKLVPDFAFCGTAYLYGSTEEEKTAEIKSYLDQGYYLVADVRYSGHWVAVDRVENGTVYMIDPARNTSDIMFDQYDFHGSTRVKMYKTGGNVVPVTPPAVTKPVSYEVGSYVTTSALNVRTEPSTNGSKIDLVENNTQINVTEVSKNWGKVSVNGQTGWICLDYTFRTGDIKEETVSYTTGTYKLTDVLNYRESPDVYSQTYGLVHTGTVLDITEVSGVWGKTVYNGKECWVCLEYADRIGDITVTEAPVTTVTEAVTTTTPAETQAPTPVVTESYEKEKLYVTSDVLNFRVGAGTDNSVICLIPAGTEVMVSSVSGNWGRTTYNGSVGWICLDYAACMDIPEETEPEVTTTQAVTEVVTEAVTTVPTTVTTVTTTETFPETTVAMTTTTVLTQATEPIVTTVTDATTTTEDVTTTEATTTVQTTVTTAPVTTTATETVTDSDVFWPEYGTEYIKGDINIDGRIDIFDIIAFVKIMLDESGTLPEPIVSAADLNNDGVISARDYAAMKMILIS